MNGSDRNVIILPSGGRFDIDRPDMSALKTAEDFMEAKYAMQEKIIGIELQIDMYNAGLREASTPADWLPRASASLKWSKLHRDEIQNRQGMAERKIKAARQATQERYFIDAAKVILNSKLSRGT